MAGMGKRPTYGLQETDQDLLKRIHASNEYERRQEAKRREPPAEGYGIDGKKLMEKKPVTDLRQEKKTEEPISRYLMFTTGEIAKAMGVKITKVDAILKQSGIKCDYRLKYRYYKPETVIRIVKFYKEYPQGVRNRNANVERLKEIIRVAEEAENNVGESSDGV